MLGKVYLEGKGKRGRFYFYFLTLFFYQEEEMVTPNGKSKENGK